MKFKNGDRVHVTRFDRKEVNFYATLTNFYFDPDAKTAELFNCSNKTFEGDNVYLQNDECFGPDKADYYTLVADEEDSEKPEVQYIDRSEQVRDWAKQQNLDIDNAFNDHKTVKTGDKVHITQLKGKKVDILRDVTNVYSDYFVIDSEFSDVFQIKVHFTDQYKIAEYGSNTALYKALYERATNEVEYLKKEIDFLQRQLEQSKKQEDE